jgi:uncharacterized protein with PIN domain
VLARTATVIETVCKLLRCLGDELPSIHSARVKYSGSQIELRRHSDVDGINRQKRKRLQGRLLALAAAYMTDWEGANIMYEELQQQSRAECPACNGQLRLVSPLAPTLNELGHRTFQCEECGRRVWVREPPLGRTEVH